ncbi:MAG: MetQ/NlpA family ABC transporter substrate-binding protein [Bacilli bacterium]
MMKTRQLLSTLLLAVGLLAGCTPASSSSSSSSTPIPLRVGASPTPHAVILEHVKPILAEQGYDLQITVFQDYVLPNIGLVDDELDANYFQHLPYLNQYNAERGTSIVSAAGIHIEPIGIYSKVYSSLDNLPNGTRVIMSNSVSDRGRLLALLEDKGLITLVEGLDPYEDAITSLEDAIATNPKNLTFEANIDAGMLVQAYNFESNCIVLINTNYALDGGLNPLEDALTLELGSQDNPYVNIIAVNAGDELDPGIVALINVLLSEPVQTWIEEEFEGAVVPAVRPE